jgi:hypothetical protein
MGIHFESFMQIRLSHRHHVILAQIFRASSVRASSIFERWSFFIGSMLPYFSAPFTKKAPEKSAQGQNKLLALNQPKMAKIRMFLGRVHATRG